MGGLLSVEDVASTLGVHVRTVRRYLREGRLKGVKIGKQYRIHSADLAALTGKQATATTAEANPRRHSEASVVVQIDAIDRDSAMQVMNGLGGAIKGRDKHSDTPLRLDTVYDETRARLKVIATGSLANTVGLMRLVEACVKR
jgi:excisionase family DNA binding protein